MKMKKVIQSFHHLWLSGLILFCFVNLSVGQEKVNISAGIGLPELINVATKFQSKQTQFGIGIGFMPLQNESVISVTGDIYYHFAGVSQLSDRRTWYARTGLVYLRDETDYFIDKYIYLNARIGKDFNFTPKMGLAFDVGLIFELYNETIRKVPPSGWDFDLEFPLLPSIGLTLFYRI